jgi:hypothetical protein
MNQRFTKFVSPLISLVLLFSAVAFTPPARAADSFVYTDFAANDFGLWSQSSIYGQDQKGSKKLEDWKQLWCSGWDDPSCSVYDN